MRKIAKLRDRSWELEVWRGLADYANASLAGNRKALRAAEQLLRNCAPDLVPGNINELIGESKAGQTPEQHFQEEAIRYQPIIKGLLRWLVYPNEKTLVDIAPTLEPTNFADFGDDRLLLPPSEALLTPVGFLNTELHDRRLQEPPDSDFDAYPFYFKSVVNFHSFAGPICYFIVNELDEFGERAPVRICEREGCGKFTVPERTGRKRFCSSQCRALSYQGSRSDWNEYMRKYRKSVKSLRKRGKK